MTIEIVKPIERSAIMPWGMQISMLLPVPVILPTGNRNIIVMNRGSGKRRVIKDSKAKTFGAHIAGAALEALAKMKQNQPELNGLCFPICGSECPIRLDIAFCFCQDKRGLQRMLRSDEDNLKKGVYDGIKGIIIDDDRWIVEGYWAKGRAPEDATEDAVLLSFSRAGFRDWKDLVPISAMAILPPWRLEDHSRVVPAAAMPGKIILPGQKCH